MTKNLDPITVLFLHVSLNNTKKSLSISHMNIKEIIFFLIFLRNKYSFLYIFFYLSLNIQVLLIPYSKVNVNLASTQSQNSIIHNQN